MANKCNYSSKTLLDVKFTPNVKGYDADEVDKILDEIIFDYANYEKFMVEAKEYISQLEKTIGELNEKIRQTDIKVSVLQNRVDSIGNADNVTNENMNYIQRLRTLEKVLYDHGINPENIK